LDGAARHPYQTDGAARRPYQKTDGAARRPYQKTDGAARHPYQKTDIAARVSLPFKVGAVAFGEVDEWPGFRTRRQLFAHWVFQDIFGFLLATFVVAQAMLKEISLPANPDLFGCPFFPFANNVLHRFARRWKRKQCVQMIGHQNEQVRPPKKRFLSVTHGLEQSVGDFWPG
jgi:hypothetical protein